jgi:hypothetical protein
MIQKIWKYTKTAFLLLVVVAIVVFVSIAPKKAASDGMDMIGLSMNMESALGLQDVMISEVTGNILEIRVKDPSVSKEKLDVGTAYIFGYIEPFIGKNLQKVRVIYTKDNFDASLFEVARADISDWTSKKIDDTTFAQKIKFVDLTKK